MLLDISKTLEAIEAKLGKQVVLDTTLSTQRLRAFVAKLAEEHGVKLVWSRPR